jgi:hypothetical protein
VNLVKAFLAHKKVKPDGNTSSHVQLHKYNNPILYDAQQALQLLPRGNYDEIDNFLNSFRKETVEVKKGKLDKQEADPISWSPFNLLLSWALDTSNIFIWTYSLLQWNSMARSISIGTLAFQNFRDGEDHKLCAAMMIQKWTKWVRSVWTSISMPTRWSL